MNIKTAPAPKKASKQSKNRNIEINKIPEVTSSQAMIKQLNKFELKIMRNKLNEKRQKMSNKCVNYR